MSHCSSIISFRFCTGSGTCPVLIILLPSTSKSLHLFPPQDHGHPFWHPRGLIVPFVHLLFYPWISAATLARKIGGKKKSPSGENFTFRRVRRDHCLLHRFDEIEVFTPGGSELGSSDFNREGLGNRLMSIRVRLSLKRTGQFNTASYSVWKYSNVSTIETFWNFVDPPVIHDLTVIFIFS